VLPYSSKRSPIPQTDPFLLSFPLPYISSKHSKSKTILIDIDRVIFYINGMIIIG
jgi:hypothetical protein